MSRRAQGDLPAEESPPAQAPPAEAPQARPPQARPPQARPPQARPPQAEAPLTGLPPPEAPLALDAIPLPRWLAPLAVLCVIGLVPWIVYLAVVLPHRARSVHYDIAWVGFDIAMWFVLAAVAWCAVRRRPAIAQLAAVAATMLIVDAWFDVVTTGNPTQRGYAIASALIVEIPLAVLCVWVAVNAQRLRERSYRRLWQRAEQAARLANAEQAAAGPR